MHSGGDYDQEDPPTKAQQEGWVSEQQRMNYKINEFALDAVKWVDGAAELSALKWAAATATVKGWFTFGSKGYSSFNSRFLSSRTFKELQILTKASKTEMNTFFKSGGKIVPSTSILKTYRELAYRIVNDTGGVPASKITETSVRIQSQRLQMINSVLKNK